jgi:hypothetical protein
MTPLMERRADSREEFRHQMTALYNAGTKAIASGKTVKMILAEQENDISARQRGFLHAAVLPQIAEQVSVNGVKYTAKVWKEFFKDLFIQDKFVMHRPPFVRDRKTGELRPSKRPVPMKLPKSTENFGIKGYSDFIDKVIAHAATEFGVVFVFDEDEREAVRWKRPARMQQGAEA